MIVCDDRLNNNTVISAKSKHFLRVKFFGIIHEEVSNFLPVKVRYSLSNASGFDRVLVLYKLTYSVVLSTINRNQRSPERPIWQESAKSARTSRIGSTNVETGVDTSSTSGRERGSSGADGMMGSGLSTEVVGCDGVVMVSFAVAGIIESVVGVKR
jgi:hypothetical protein